MTTVVVITIKSYNEYNVSLIHHIKSNCSHDVILAWDDKSGHIPQYPDFENSYTKLHKIFGNKIHNFNGRWKNNPSKLGAILWFSTSKYDKMWLFEDDVYVRNIDNFIKSYDSYCADIICKSEKIPKWFSKKWRISDETKISKNMFKYAHLYCVRFSRYAAQKIVESFHCHTAINHHELWVPYVAYKYNLKWSDIKSYHKIALTTNPTSKDNYSIDKGSEMLLEICHPFKHKIEPFIPNAIEFLANTFNIPI